MNYFRATTSLTAPDLPVPQDLQLWADGAGGQTLTWRRATGGCDGYVVLRGDSASALVEVARVPERAQTGRLRHWRVPAEGGRLLAVACYRGETVGAASAPLCSAAPPEAPATGTASTPPVSPRTAQLARSIPAEPACQCCDPPQPLVIADAALVCVFSGEPHLLLATGEALRIAELPYGVCGCCDPPQPLLRSGDTIVCYGRPDQEYRRVGSRYVPRPTTATAAPLADADAIDAALRANSALLGVNGVFVRET